MNKRRIWIIEMWEDEEYTTVRPRWGTTGGAALTKNEGLEELRDWKQRNPCTKFRLRCYVPRAKP